MLEGLLLLIHRILEIRDGILDITVMGTVERSPDGGTDRKELDLLRHLFHVQHCSPQYPECRVTPITSAPHFPPLCKVGIVTLPHLPHRGVGFCSYCLASALKM